jgi:hypothetical protein
MIVTRMISLVGLLLMQVVAEQTLRPLFDFAGPEAAQQWQAVNDGVMGGVSEGRFRITPDKKLEFFGTLSLENNGGFASVRTKPTELNLKAGDAIVVRAKGDGGETKTDAVVLDRRVVRAAAGGRLGERGAGPVAAPPPTQRARNAREVVPLPDVAALIERAVGTRAAMRSGSWPTFPMTRWPSSQPPR